MKNLNLSTIKNIIMKNFSILLFSVLFFSCQQKENKHESPEVNPQIENKEITTEKAQKENTQTGDTIFMNYKDDRGMYTAEGSIDSVRTRIYIKFKNENPGQVNGKIIPAGGKGNIRFNQIIFPDKSSDGPFGMDLKLDLPQKGNHILVIGHSQMADNPYFGTFKVELEVKK